ncbi:hypothetical protein [Sulfurovum sp. NBC37-1]|uniref:hypothetical protein n=1 Tax=Sulfurovum sp. (strain NBC37-1) TaxID=387093 RepID=UPI000158765B|nr:hypothetical protein [Sulfurovum sp. NBC37-1]BAF71248.1 conserved hypothetical protein [Sulfurovum sp. NBC37-1]
MTHLPRVALEIKTIGLYDLVLQDVQKIAGKSNVSEDEIIEIMQTNPQILEDYKQINVEYNLSNIHLRDIDLSKVDSACHKAAKEVNENLEMLREIEKYTLDFEQSSTLVIIFSIEFFVLFSVQYFIVLMDLKEWQILIYSIFASSIAVAWWYAKKEQKKYALNNEKFEKLYKKTLELIVDMERQGCIEKSDLIIDKGEEHV